MVSSSVARTRRSGQRNATGSKRKYAVISILFLLPITAGVIAFVWIKHINSPDYIFWKSFDSALTTQSVTQQTSSYDDINVLYNFQNNKDPRVSTESTISGYKVHGYGSLQNTYINVDRPANDFSTGGFDGFWAKGRTNGIAPDHYSNQNILVQSIEPRGLLFGDYIFANLNKGERSSLIKYLKLNHVYSFDKATAKKVSSGNTSVMWMYSVHWSDSSLADYNKLVAPYFGLRPNEVSTTITHSPKGAIWYIDAKTKRLVKIVLPDGAGTTLYTNYNKTTLPAEPKTNTNWDEFVSAIQVKNYFAVRDTGQPLPFADL